MRVKKVIDVDVKCCKDCPYYYEDQDMGATHHCCELKGKAYDAFLEDLSWANGDRPNQRISIYCPLLSEEEKKKIKVDSKKKWCVGREVEGTLNFCKTIFNTEKEANDYIKSLPSELQYQFFTTFFTTG